MFKKVMSLEKERLELLNNLVYQSAKLAALTKRQQEWAAMLREKAEAKLKAEELADQFRRNAREPFGFPQRGSENRPKAAKTDEPASSAEREKLLENLRKANRGIEALVQEAGKTQAQLEKAERQAARLISSARQK